MTKARGQKWNTEMDKKCYKKEEEEISLDHGKDGWKVKTKYYGRSSVRWMHRLITIGVICYLVGAKGWL